MGSCFRLAAEKYSYVLRPDREVRIVRLLETLRDSQAAPGYGQELLDKALVTQFLIAVTRDLEARQLQYVASASCDEKIVSILKYLNLHLSERQSIDSLSRQFYISKYYMMRRFKAETGYTIHGYLTEKRRAPGSGENQGRGGLGSGQRGLRLPGLLHLLPGLQKEVWSQP